MKSNLHFLLSTLLCCCVSLANSQCQPQFSDFPISITADCSVINPEFSAVSVSSDCCESTSLQSLVVPTGQVVQSCDLSTAFGPGLDWAVWLPGVNPNSVVWTFDNVGSMLQLENGYALITGHIRSAANSNWGFDVFMLLHNGTDWNGWSSQGRSYKDDFNVAGNNYLNWTYYEMAPGFCYLSGTGAIAGSHLQLTHQPSNYYYGFQIGAAANNKNTANGISGWFYYNGLLNGSAITGHGDLNANASCNDVNDSCGSRSYTKYWRASDNCGNNAYTEQLWQALDTTPPSFTDVVAELEVNCEETDQVFVNATDDCSAVEITYSDQVIVDGCNGTIVRTYTATDGCGNTSTITQTLQLFGLGAPVFTNFPEDITVECGLWDESAQPTITFTEGCGNALLSLEEIISSGDCGNAFTIQRVYTLTDDCGNVTTQTWTITAEDNTPPVLFNIPQDVTLSCGTEAPGDNVFAVDNCEGLSVVSLTAQTFDNDCGFTVIRTWTSTDACGNSAQQSQTITYVDDTPPFFISIPEGGSTSCGSLDNEVQLPAAEDACSSVVVTYNDETTVLNCGFQITRTFIATDGCGNSTEAEIFFTVEDTESPTFSEAPTALVFDCVAGDIVAPEASDNCSEVNVSVSDQPLFDCAGSFIRVYTATDECGNSASFIQTITIRDLEAPQLVSLPASPTVSCTTIPDEFTPEFVDNCSNVSVTPLEPFIVQGDCPGSYTITRRWFAQDECGNGFIQTWDIQVVDNTAPEFISTPPSTLNLECGEIAPFIEPFAIDECTGGGVELVYSESVSGNQCANTIVRTWTATDECGNTSSFSQTINITDTAPPVLQSFPADLNLECGQTIPFPETVVALDACAGQVTVSTTDLTIPGDCPGETTILRLYRAFDNCGNSAIYAQTITISDNTPPQFLNTNSFVQITCSNSQTPIVNVQDACSSVELFFEDIELEPGCGGLLSRTYTAIDACGNVATLTQTVQLIDNTPPVLQNLPPAELFIECGQEAPDVFVFAQDNCSGLVPVSLTASTEEFDCGFLFTRTWTATDACGNASSFTQTIVAEDTTAPILIGAPADQTISCTGDLPPVPAVSAEDACGGFLPVDFQEETIGISLCPTIERTWCATDCAGNQTCHIQVITLLDNGADFGIAPFKVVPENETEFNITWRNPDAEDVIIEVYNLNGQMVQLIYRGDTIGGAAYNFDLNTSNLATGMYIIQAKTPSESYTEKIMVR